MANEEICGIKPNANSIYWVTDEIGFMRVGGIVHRISFSDRWDLIHIDGTLEQAIKEAREKIIFTEKFIAERIDEFARGLREGPLGNKRGER